MSSVRSSLTSVGGSLFSLTGLASPVPTGGGADVVISGPIGAAPPTRSATPGSPAGIAGGASGTSIASGTGGPDPAASDATTTTTTTATATSSTTNAAAGAGTATGSDVRGSFQTGLFQENFWGDTETFAGFQVLHSYMKRGRKEVGEMLDILKERIQIEEDYARRLAKLSRVAMDVQGFGMTDKANEEPSTLKAAWKEMRDVTTALAWRQQQFAQDIQQVVYAPLEGLRDAHKSTVAATVATSTAIQKEFAAQRALVPKLKKSYEAKCKELDSAREELSSPANIVGVKGSKNEKLAIKVARLQKEMEQANDVYKNGVHRLEQLRVSWEEDMMFAASLFEGLEMKRVNSAKAALEQYGEIERRVHASYASNAEALKVKVAAVDAQTDIETFVATHRTGWARPGPTLYENYYTGLLKDAVFGVPLQTHLEITGRKVPTVIERCAEYVEAQGLKHEGLYRLSGRANRVRQLKNQFDKDAGAVDLTGPDIHISDVTSLLKLYVRELPEPLTTFALYSDWLKSVEVPAEEQPAKMRALVARLPEGNRATLAYLLGHLRRVADNAEWNKMTAPNLAIVFAPGLVRNADDAASMRDFQLQCDVAVALLKHCGAIFEPQST